MDLRTFHSGDNKDKELAKTIWASYGGKLSDLVAVNGIEWATESAILAWLKKNAPKYASVGSKVLAGILGFLMDADEAH
jgi:hypothetical protein